MFSLKKSRFPLLCHFGQLAILAALAAAPRVPPLANEVFKNSFGQIDLENDNYSGSCHYPELSQVAHFVYYNISFLHNSIWN